MIRKLLLLAAMCITALAVSSASASAVIVENDGMHTVTGDNTIRIHGSAFGGTVEVTALECENLWEADVSSTGAVDIHDINIDPGTGTQGGCEEADDCDGSGWDGQIVEGHGDESWEYAINVVFCIEGQGGPLDGVPVEIECEIDNDEVHCGALGEEEESIVGTFFIPPPINQNVNFYVEGELDFDTPLGLMHDEA